MEPQLSPSGSLSATVSPSPSTLVSFSNNFPDTFIDFNNLTLPHVTPTTALAEIFYSTSICNGNERCLGLAGSTLSTAILTTSLGVHATPHIYIDRLMHNSAMYTTGSQPFSMPACHANAKWYGHTPKAICETSENGIIPQTSNCNPYPT